MNNRTIQSFASATVIAVALSAPLKAAEILSCAAEIDLLAQQYGLAADLPKTGPAPRDMEAPLPQSEGIAPNDLSRSQGVIAPETNPPARIITPDKNIDPDMAKPKADTTPPNTARETPGSLDAAKRTQMQGLVDAARQEQRQGHEKECLERIAQARAIPEPG